MKFFVDEKGTPTLELTERNITILLEKLDDPASARVLVDPDHVVAVHAVESRDTEENTPWITSGEGPYSVVHLLREDLEFLLYQANGTGVAPPLECHGGSIVVVGVPDSKHYSNRNPGEMYMPTSGEYR